MKCTPPSLERAQTALASADFSVAHASQASLVAQHGSDTLTLAVQPDGRLVLTAHHEYTVSRALQAMSSLLGYPTKALALPNARVGNNEETRAHYQVFAGEHALVVAGVFAVIEPLSDLAEEGHGKEELVGGYQWVGIDCQGRVIEAGESVMDWQRAIKDGAAIDALDTARDTAEALGRFLSSGRLSIAEVQRTRTGVKARVSTGKATVGIELFTGHNNKVTGVAAASTNLFSKLVARSYPGEEALATRALVVLVENDLSRLPEKTPAPPRDRGER